ncbi:hypothetical protein BSKO_06248 [Bryopsis sp. KO-2023]|nr:hypothetical protein BSKO_06248 [Bryopsis sp. KO-2023]
MAHACLPLQNILRRRARDVVTVCDGRSRNGAQFYGRVAALSRAFGEDLGVKPGDRVAIAGQSTDAFFEAFLAITACGGVPAPLNWRWSLKEASYAFELCEATVLVFDSSTAGLWRGISRVSSKLRCGMVLGTATDGATVLPTSFHSSEALITERMGSELKLQWAPRDQAFVCFTSGSTGRPKAVVLSHTALHSQSLAKLAVVSYSYSDVYLHTAPLFHIGGISSGMAMLMAGAKHIFMPKFSGTQAAALARQFGVTALIAVPAMIVDIANQEDPIHSVQTVLIGGGKMTETYRTAAHEVFPNARLYTAYGMTEACSSITFQGPFLPNSSGGAPLENCAGFPAPGIEIAVHSKNGTGEGEILTRGPHVMSGYWGQSEETTKAIDADGWLKTGDIGRLQLDGSLILSGRIKDVIKSGGENVHASEVEGVIGAHGAVSQVAVVGVSDLRMGELVSAAINLKEGWCWPEEEPLKEADFGSDVLLVGLGGEESEGKREKEVSLGGLLEHCSESGLSRFKIPRFWVVQRKPLPVTSSGKLRKEEIRSMLNKARLKMSDYYPRSRL